MNYQELPGVERVSEAYGETTVLVEPSALPAVCSSLRDEHGFNVLSDISATDYLGYGARGVSGYIATPAGRDLNSPMTQGLQALPEPKPKRFAVSYHLLAVGTSARRLRVQLFVDEGDPVPSVVGVWPTADWHEREAFDLFGIAIDGHPNLTRILTPEDWEGHPLRKDYPIGGEPVRFSEAE